VASESSISATSAESMPGGHRGPVILGKRCFLLAGCAWALVAISFALNSFSSSNETTKFGASANALHLTSNVTLMAAASCTLMLASTRERAEYRSFRLYLRVIVPCLDVVAILTLIMLSPSHADDWPEVRGVLVALILLHMILYTGYMMWAMIEFHALLTILSGESDDNPIANVSAQLSRVGLFVGYLWIAQNTVVHVGALFTLPTEIPGLSDIFCVCCMVPLAIGTTGPLWISLTSGFAVARWWHMHVLYRRLGPLWTAIVTTLPQFTLVNVGRPGIRWKLHRRVIEIRDAQLFLAPYTPSEHCSVVRDTIADLAAIRPNRVGAGAEAVRLAAALRSYRLNQRLEATSTGSPSGGQVGKVDTVTCPYGCCQAFGVSGWW